MALSTIPFYMISERITFGPIHCSLWNQEGLFCPSPDEWIQKMWHIYTMEYYSAIKRNEIELFVVRWMDLETVRQSE